MTVIVTIRLKRGPNGERSPSDFYPSRTLREALEDAEVVSVECDDGDSSNRYHHAPPAPPRPPAPSPQLEERE
ncbi:MAG: hypothetical protein U9Q81_15040 [Pseudomonadota bacterium]|nr:hypothetical protein [Pseudomonadota bacterium]